MRSSISARCSILRFRLHPRCGLRPDAALPKARNVAVSRPAVGVVQTPQHFINPDPIQINLGATKFWPDEQRFFFDIVLPSKDAWSAAFCCGTSSIIRMRPLMEIGGFPVELGDRGLSPEPAAQGEGLSDGLSERALDLRPGAGGPQGIHHPAQPLVSRLHADRARAQRPAVFRLAARVHRPSVAGGGVPQLDRGPFVTGHRPHHSAGFTGLRPPPLPRFALRSRDPLPALLVLVRSRDALALGGKSDADPFRRQPDHRDAPDPEGRPVWPGFGRNGRNSRSPRRAGIAIAASSSGG